MEVETVARQYLRASFGNMVMLGQYQYEEEPRLHRFRLCSNYPFLVTDDSDSGEVLVRVIKMEHLGHIFIDEKMHVDQSLTSKRKDVDSKIRDTLRRWRNRIEEVVATATSNHLAKLDRFYVYFTPVERIIVDVLDQGHFSTADMAGMDRSRKASYMSYVSLLEGQDLLERHNGGWRPTVAMHSLMSMSDNVYGMTRRIMSVLIGSRYRTLVKDFNMTVIEGLIRLQNVIYLPEIETKRTLSRTRFTLTEEYVYHYRKSLARLDLLGLLQDLTHIASVEHDEKKRMYQGQSDLLETMIKETSKLTPIGSLHMARA